jgi:N-acetyltransferase
MEWGREEERESLRVGVIEVMSQVRLTNGKRGRIISCPAECTGKIGSKVRPEFYLKYIGVRTWLK